MRAMREVSPYQGRRGAAGRRNMRVVAGPEARGIHADRRNAYFCLPRPAETTRLGGLCLGGEP